MHIPSLKEVVSAEEWALRCDLAACYRLVAAYGWSDLVFTHISAKLPDSVTGGEHQFLINPYGLMFDEITASSLVKVDMACNKLLDSPFPVNPAGFVIHSAVHEARPEAGCVLHTHTRAGVAVSAQKGGVLPISQQSTFVLGSLAYHEYEGVAFRDEEKPRLQADLGNANFLMLRNHGLLTVGQDDCRRLPVDVHLREHLPHPDRCPSGRRADAGEPADRERRGPGHARADRRPGRCLCLARAAAQSAARPAWIRQLTQPVPAAPRSGRRVAHRRLQESGTAHRIGGSRPFSRTDP